MTSNNEQYRSRLAFLQNRVGEVLFSRDVYEKITSLVKAMANRIDDIDTVIFDLEEERVRALLTLLLGAIPVGDSLTLRLSLLDCFDLERISLLAERDLEAFFGENLPKWS